MGRAWELLRAMQRIRVVQRNGGSKCGHHEAGRQRPPVGGTRVQVSAGACCAVHACVSGAAQQGAPHLKTVLVPMLSRLRKYLSLVWWYSQSSALKKDAMECEAEMSSCTCPGA